MGNSWDNKATSPQFTTSIITDSSTFNLLNTTVTTLSAFGAVNTLNLGYTGTASSSTNFYTNAVASGNNKTVNIATGGAAGSFTSLNLGSVVGNSAITANGSLFVGINGSGYTPSSYALAGLNIVWNKNANASGATYFQNFRQGGSGGFIFELYDVNPTLIHTPLSIDGGGNTTFSGYLLSSSSTGGIGYTSSARGAVTQSTSITTSVTINSVCGQITMYPHTWTAGETVILEVSNSTVGAYDTVVASSKAYFGARFTTEVTYLDYQVFSIIVKNTDSFSSSTNASLKINFTVIKAG